MQIRLHVIIFFIFQLVAHEMGHNLGMLHTWADPHKSNGCETKVDGQYVVIRSDDDISGGPWSSCSKTDFEAHYLQYKDNWCMEGNCWY